MPGFDPLLSDRTKFCLVTEPLHKLLLRVEDKVNRLLTKLKKDSAISDDTYNELHASGSNPGILYGLPKIHKPNVPLRPIFRACGTATYAQLRIVHLSRTWQHFPISCTVFALREPEVRTSKLSLETSLRLARSVD